MDNTLTIVIDKDDKQEVLISLEDGKVIGGSIRKSETEFQSLEVTDEYELCGYPYVKMRIK